MMSNSRDIDDLLAVPERMETGGASSPPRASTPRKGKQHAGRFEMLNAFVDTQLADCTRAELAVWLVLFRDSRDGRANAAQSWIAKRAGVDERTVRRALGVLRKRGLVVVLKQGGPNVGAAIYRACCRTSRGGNDVR